MSADAGPTHLRASIFFTLFLLPLFYILTYIYNMHKYHQSLTVLT